MWLAKLRVGNNLSRLFPPMGFYYLSAMSVILGSLAAYLVWRRMALLLFAERADGQFVRWQRNGRHNYPVVRFMTRDGKVCEFVGGIGSSNQPDYDRFKVLYPPGNPDKAMIANFLHFWGAPLVILFMAGVLAYAAADQ